MSRTSCISHPSDDRFIVLRKWALDFCDGDHCAAMLLAYFEGWHNYRLRNVEQGEVRRQALASSSGLVSDNVDLWQWHTLKKIQTDLFGLFSRRRIIEARKILVAKKVLTESRNPNPRFRFDRTVHYLFHPEVCNRWLRLYQQLDASARTIDDSCGDDGCAAGDDACAAGDDGQSEVDAACAAGTEQYYNKRKKIRKIESEDDGRSALSHKLDGTEDTITMVGGTKSRSITQPTLEEWLAHASEIGWTDLADAERTFHYYTANGWRQPGGNVIRDWRAAARGCAKRHAPGRDGGRAVSLDAIDYDGAAKRGTI